MTDLYIEDTQINRLLAIKKKKSECFFKALNTQEASVDACVENNWSALWHKHSFLSVQQFTLMLDTLNTLSVHCFFQLFNYRLIERTDLSNLCIQACCYQRTVVVAAYLSNRSESWGWYISVPVCTGGGQGKAGSQTVCSTILTFLSHCQPFWVQDIRCLWEIRISMIDEFVPVCTGRSVWSRHYPRE